MEEIRYQREQFQYTKIANPVHPQHRFQVQSPVDGRIAAKIIQEAFPRLLQVDTDSLVGGLFSKYLISIPTFNKVNDSPENLKRALLEALGIIKKYGEKFNELLLILADEPVHEDLALFLKTEYGELFYNYNYKTIIYNNPKCIFLKLLCRKEVFTR